MISEAGENPKGPRSEVEKKGFLERGNDPLY